MKIPQATPPRGYHFRDVQLEMSLKPFWDNSPATQEAVCRELFQQWMPLCRHAESISLMLWIGDGSEILEYAGNPDESFEWARYHGAANPIAWHAAPGARDSGDPDHNAIGMEARLRDPDRRGVHQRSYLYRPAPATFTFAWLARLVKTVKRVGTEMSGKKILVGTTFDIGPEFAISRFKYEWHPEICGGGSLFGGKFIRCDAELKADDRTYAGFPHGIPEGTPIGTFLGRQSREFFDYCSFDFLWFSNGFGFGLEPWSLTGAIFDGKNFHPVSASETSTRILEFWRTFRAELPDVPVRTRGTNLATGIDLGSDASPIRDIYRDVSHVEPPVNSPWAALDGDIGLELAGWMSHIARTPGNGFRFRYYIHDPWWLNSPWLDRYQRQPFDIYLPLSVCRLTGEGEVEAPCDIGFLSVDDSHGCLPPVVPTEVIPHILHAREFLPDAPGPIVWIYPFDEYHDLVFGSAPNPALPFSGDWFVRGMIAQGISINTVACSADIAQLVKKPSLKDSILLAPVQGGSVDEALLAHAKQGGKVLFYGPLDTADSLRELLGLALEEPLAGDFSLSWEEGQNRSLRHLDFLSGGGWREVATETSGENIEASQGGRNRTASSYKKFSSGGRVGWVRGSLATAEFDPAQPAAIKGPRLKEMDARQFVAGEELARHVLSQLGMTVGFQKEEPLDRSPILTIHRHRNAFVFSGYQPDSSVSLRLALPAGAPLFPGGKNRISGGSLIYTGPPAWHHVCRAFVEQQKKGYVACRILPPIQHGYRSRLLVSGLCDATVRFFPEPGTEDKLEILRQPMFPYFQGDFVQPVFETGEGNHVIVKNVTGELLFSW